MTVKSLLQYYQENQFNPVPIALDELLAWESHFAKRRNLYERHLGIPISLLSVRSILEFGCNSGENALVLAAAGANLTLVEPNEQVLPRLKTLFQQFGLTERIVQLVQAGIDLFESETLYDAVLAEGFLYTLPNRSAMIQKLGKLLKPGGFAVITFGDRSGLLLEMTRRLVLWRAYQLRGVDNVHGESALDLAKRLYWEDFARLNASRPFEVWWKDTLVNPFLTSAYHWSYPELLAIAEATGYQFYSSSPKWVSIDHFKWYKDVDDRKSWHQQILENLRAIFPFFLTGLRPSALEWQPTSVEVIDSVAEFTAQIADYQIDSPVESVFYPPLLEQYLNESQDSTLRLFNSEMKNLYEAVQSSQLEDLISAYHRTQCLRTLWGTANHYICFSKVSES
jgi:SAM-dependent methyltransferase